MSVVEPSVDIGRAAPEGSRGSLGIIVIGRNEGELLRAALEAAPSGASISRLYVDSGSSDGSVALAKSMGIDVHELDTSKPFSPARARREGVEVLLGRPDPPEFIQFVDGDSELREGWVQQALAFLQAHPDVGIVCGRIDEKHPELSIYNRITALQRTQPEGEIAGCGGIFMVRASSYVTAGGFDERLLTREEKDLCDRVKKQGYRVFRIPVPMAVHDSGLLHFSQWWQRAVWGGYGDAIQVAQEFREKGSLSREHLRRVRTYVVWPVLLPLMGIIGLIGGVWSVWWLLLPLVCLGAYVMLFGKLAIGFARNGERLAAAATSAALLVLRKFSTGAGFVRYFLESKFTQDGAPDPHVR